MIKGINLPYPFGRFIVSGISSGILTSVPFNLESELFCIIENSKVIGICSFNEHSKIKKTEVDKLFDKHKMTTKDIEYLWPNRSSFYFHEVKLNLIVKPMKIKETKSYFIQNVNFDPRKILAVQ